MKGHVYKPGCKCPKSGRCRCKAKWGFLVDVGTNPETGKRKQKFKGGFDTKKEAEEVLSEFLSGGKNKKYKDPSKMFFCDLAEEWLVAYEKRPHIKDATIRVRRHEIDKLNSKLRFLKIREIDHEVYQDALDDLKLRGKKGERFSDSTMSGVAGTAGQIFAHAMKKKYIREDPTEYATLIKDEKTVADIENHTDIPLYMEKDELAIFLDGTYKYGLERDVETFHTIAYSGIRVGEWCALDFPSLDYVEDSLFISKTLYNPTNHGLKYKLVTPKTAKSVRRIKMDHEIMKMLRALEIEQKKIKLRNPNYFDGKFVSAQPESHKYPGRPEVVKTVERRMKRILQLTGLNENYTPHSLRHTHVSLLAEAGVSLEVIMDRLGHGDDEVTKQVYLHVTKDLKKEAAQRFSDLMNGLR